MCPYAELEFRGTAQGSVHFKTAGPIIDISNSHVKSCTLCNAWKKPARYARVLDIRYVAERDSCDFPGKESDRMYLAEER